MMESIKYNEQEEVPAMKCSCCGNEMQSGFVRAMGRGGVCWVTENRPMGAAVGCPGFLLLGNPPIRKRTMSLPIGAPPAGR